MANLNKNLYPIWVNSAPISNICDPTEIINPGLMGMQTAYVIRTGDDYENEMLKGFMQTFSPITEFSCGVGYLTDFREASNIITGAFATDINEDKGRVVPSQLERFSVEGLNGFYANGNGEYVMSTFLRNGKFCYLNKNKWAIWYNNDESGWTMTDALNFHPSKTDYNFKLKNENSDPAAGLYKDEGELQTGYGSNSIKEQLVTNLPPINYEGKIQKIASCKTHTLFLDDTGCVWGTGKNTFNQLGSDADGTTSIPIKLSDSDVADIIVSDDKSFLIKINGSAVSVGENKLGELGLDFQETNSVVRNINGYSYKNNFGKPDSFSKIAGGDADDVVLSIKSSRNFSYILKVETINGIRRKVLYSCGFNSHGQLGLGHYYDDPEYGVGLSLVISESLDNNVFFDVGETHAMYIRQGNLFGVGKSDNYQVGDVNDSKSYIEQPYLVTAFDGVKCKRVACGLNFTIALLEDNTLWATGDNSFGQCGVPNTTVTLSGFNKVLTNVKDFSVGDNHMLVLTYDNKLYSAGNNQYGQCATEVGFAKTSKIDSKHTSNGFARCQLGQADVTGDVSYINAEGDCSFFTIDDKMYGVGFNVNGNLGIGSVNNISLTTELSVLG